MTVKEVIDDALAATALLQETIGHSLGGFLMPRIAWPPNRSGLSGFISLADADRGSTAKLVRAMPAYWLDVRGAHHSAMKRPAPSRRRLRGRVRRYR